MRNRKPTFAAAPRAGTIARSGRILAVWTVSAALLGGSVAPAVAATTQGAIANPSTGTVAITATVLARAQISGLTDVNFNGVDPANAQSIAQSDCVWSNTAGKGYTLTASGSGASNAFTLVYSSKTVPYSVQWANTTGQTTGTALVSGTATGTLVSTAVLPGCTASTTNTSLIVSMAAADLQTMQAGAAYTGTLTLVVAPQ